MLLPVRTLYGHETVVVSSKIPRMSYSNASDHEVSTELKQHDILSRHSERVTIAFTSSHRQSKYEAYTVMRR